MSKNEDLINKRLKILKIAEEIGISKAAELYKISRQTITRWRKKRNEGGITSLSNSSKKHQKQPNKMPIEIEKKIIQLKLNNSDYSPAKIAKILNINYSLKTIYKKLKAAGFNDNSVSSICDISQNCLSENNPLFKNFSLSIKHVPQVASSDIPVYLYIMKDLYTKIRFVSFSYEKTSISTTIFVDYCLGMLKNKNICRSNESNKVQIYYQKKCQLSENDILNKIIGKHNIAFLEHNDETKKIVKRSKLYHYLDEKLFVNLEQIKTTEEFISNVYARMVWFNYNALDIFNESEIDEDSKNISSILKNIIWNVPPIILGSYIHSLNDICSLEGSDDLYEDGNKSLKNLSRYAEKIADNSYGDDDQNILLDYYNIAIEILENLNDSYLIVLLQKKGDLLAKIGLWDQVEDILKRTIALAKHYGDRNNLGISYKLLGAHYNSQNRYTLAKKYFELQNKIGQELNDSALICGANNNIAAVLQGLGKPIKSMRQYKIALKIAEENEFIEKKIVILGNIGELYNSKSNYKHAMEYFQKAYKLIKNLDKNKSSSWLLNNMGLAYAKLCDNDSATLYLNKALKLSQDAKDQLVYASVLCNLGKIYIRIGNYNIALENLKKSLKISCDLGTSVLEADNCRNIAKIYLCIKIYKRANDYIDRSIDICLKNKNKHCLTTGMTLKAVLLYKEKHYNQAKELCEEAIVLAKKIGDTEALFDISMIEIKSRLKKVLLSETLKSKEIKIIEILLSLQEFLNEEKERKSPRENIAELNYQLWKITERLQVKFCSVDNGNDLYCRIIGNFNSDEFRKNASKIYKQLLKKTCNILYRDRYAQLEAGIDSPIQKG